MVQPQVKKPRPQIISWRAIAGLELHVSQKHVSLVSELFSDTLVLTVIVTLGKQQVF